MKKLIILTVLLLSLVSHAFSEILPNQKISKGNQVFTSKGVAPYLVDNRFNTTSWTASNDSWIAIHTDSGPSKIFFNWNNPSYAWSNELSPTHCPNNNAFPVDYNLLVSSNSTNGSDGNWLIADSIRNNIVCARGHFINYEGASWVKMQIINGGGQIDEIQVFDVSNSCEDIWFFVGTSISANTYKGTPPTKNYADLITDMHSEYNPAMIRGGIGCISSTDFVGNLSKYLKMAGNAHFWAIEMGTNDAWGGSNGNVALFKKNLQRVIDSCKVVGIQPIIARVLATNKMAAGWQVHADYLKAVDDLTIKNNLQAGPDLYTWFLTHPGDLNADGVHPNASGAANIQRLWVEKMESLYGGCTSTDIIPHIQVNHGALSVLATTTVFVADSVVLSPTAESGGNWLWRGPDNFCSSTREVILEPVILTHSGDYVVTYTNRDSCTSSYTFKITVKVKTDVDDEHVDENIAIYPNPSIDGKLTVLINDFQEQEQILIFDIDGKLVFSSYLSQRETQLDTGLGQGSYFIQLKNELTIRKQKIIIK